MPGRSGRIGAVGSSAWIWDFSSTLTTTALCGGFRYSPTTSRILASSSGSVENLNVCVRHGCTFHFRQIRATVANDIPSSAPSRRADQCVTPRCGGGAASVAANTASSSWVAGRPERGRSPSAASPPARYRLRQVSTVGPDTPTRRAISALATPCEASSTIRARVTSDTAALEARSTASNRSLSPSFRTRGAAIVGMYQCPRARPQKSLTTRDTSGASLKSLIGAVR